MTTALVYKTADQLASPSTWHKISFDTVEHDPNGLFDTTNERFVVPAGYTKARVTGQMWMGGSSPGARGVQIMKNGSSVTPGTPNADYTDNGTATTSLPISSAVLTVTQGDYFELFMWHGHSSNKWITGVNSSPTPGNNWFGIELFA